MLLDVEIAEKFINKLTAYTNYNVNIMNEKGIIIASRDVERVGKFHEIAFALISNRQDIVEVSEKNEFLGVQPGVNLTLAYEGKRIGVVGVTGEPQKVRPVALIIKMSVETMLEYEYHRELQLKRQNLKEQFITQLVYENNPERSKLKNMAQKLEYKENCLRIPIVCVTEEGTDVEAVLERLKKGEEHTSQDISMVTHDRKVVIFKTLPKTENIFAIYKSIVSEYLKKADCEPGVQKECRFFVGSIQCQFSYYQSAFQHCLWMESHVYTEAKTVFFYDYADQYLKDILPMLELHKIFNVFSREFSESFTKNYVEIMETLKKNNYNLGASSRELFVHKNTLTFRFDKIRNELDMNPIREANDRTFMELLYTYLKKQK